MRNARYVLPRCLLLIAIASTAAFGDELTRSSSPANTDHWSFQSLDRGPTPIVRDRSWPRTVVDKYILADLEAAGLSPNAQATRSALIRRLTYDLIGLPPSPDEVDSFVADIDPNAYEKLVDRLLASPQYGERWGRHWLDVVRYADSNDMRAIGTRHDITETYRYRDWVVRSLNGDLRYDRFMMDQIAGDLLPAATQGEINRDGIIATGMLAFGSWGPGDSDGQKMHADMVDDMINVTTRAFLALTVGCARCHDHKYDPITQTDYYALAGIFFSTEIAPPGTSAPWVEIPLVGNEVIEKYNHQENVRKEAIKEIEKQLTEFRDQAYRSQVATYIPQTSRYLDMAFRYLMRPPASGSEPAVIDSALVAQLDKESQLADLPRQRIARSDALLQWIDFLLTPPRPINYGTMHQLESKAFGREGIYRWHSGGTWPYALVNASDTRFDVPSHVANTYYGRIVHSESTLDGIEQYQANKVHLNTDDGAPTNGIMSLLFRAPEAGRYDFSIKLTGRIKAEGKRDPFFHIVVNNGLKEQGVLRGFEATQSFDYEQVELKAGDTFEVCATGGGETFPLAIMETDVAVTRGEQTWDAGREFHSPHPGSPIVSGDNPLAGNVWEYGYRTMQGEICADWASMNPSLFKHLMMATELGPDSNTTDGSGPDLNTWSTPAVGQLAAHGVALHPGLKSRVAVEWISPIEGHIRLRGAIHDLQGIEDGVRWRLDYQPGSAEFTVASGVVRDGLWQTLSYSHDTDEPIEVSVDRGDVLRLSLHPQDNAVADITRIEWTVQQLDGDQREWNLAEDLMAASARGSLSDETAWRLLDMAPAKLNEVTAAVPDRPATRRSEDPLRLFADWLHAYGVSETADAADADAIQVGIRQTQLKLDKLTAELAEHPDQREAVVVASEVGALYIELIAETGPFRFSQRNDEALLPAEALAEVQRLQGEQDKLQKQTTPRFPVAMGGREGGPKATKYAGFSDARIHENGHYAHLGEVVPRGFPRFLAGKHAKRIPDNTSGRQQLAEWIADPANPLPARVLVNRIWLHHFGQGLVRTPGNFGLLGEAPTHPRLLDYLAQEFIASGWSIKHIHRQIVLSATYRQSTAINAKQLAVDPGNRLWSRMVVRRMEAEAIRDTLLAVSQRLDQRIGGPVVRMRQPDADAMSVRRALYLMTNRSDKSGFRFLFDAADPESVVDQRNVSTVAPQSLFLLNHPFVLELLASMAEFASDGLTPASSDEDLATNIDRLYKRLYARAATPREVQLGVGMFRQRLAKASGEERQAAFVDAWQQYCQVLLCTNELIYLN